MDYGTFFQARIWCCLQCGFIYEGKQPKNECPACHAYKSSFADFPQHLEAALRDEFPKLPPNHRDVRVKRVQLLKEYNLRGRATDRGRTPNTQSGQHISLRAPDAL